MNTNDENKLNEGIATTSESSLAAAHGWAALRKDIERRLSEARRERQMPRGVGNYKYVQAFYDGEIAALDYLLGRDDRRREVPPNDQLTNPAAK